MMQKRSKNLEPILRTMRTILDPLCPVTLKMRMGWSSDELTAMTLLPIAARSGVAAVTIHGRTRQQRYTKQADWSFIKKAATFAKDKLNNLPLIANGDVYSFEDYEELVNAQSDVATCMIGRGALVKPWLFTEIKERRHWDISASERLDLMRDYVSYGLEHFGSDARGVESTRRFLLEFCSFAHRYVPVGLLERPRVNIQQKNPPFYARSDLEQLLSSSNVADWIRISEMLIGPVPEGFKFTPKHKSSTQSEEV
jgi:tRNA-dihydrouridine synthase 3